MKKIISFLFLALLFSTITFSQISIWEEDFTYPDFTTVGTANRWTITTSGGPNYFEVRSNEFRASDTNVIDQILETESIDISSYSSISLNVDIRLVSGDTEASDYIKVYYVLDGGAETLFSTNGENFDAFDTTATQENLNGSIALEKLFIKMVNQQILLEPYKILLKEKKLKKN